MKVEKGPLSFYQERLWFLDQMIPNSSLYNIPQAKRFRGALSITALKQALNEIICRHDVLRTVFTMMDGKPAQVIKQPWNIKVPIIDLSNFRVDKREAEVQLLMAEEAHIPFDLKTGPLVRVKLLRITDQEYVFLLTMHHIVSDGWSLGIFYQELLVLYEAFLHGNLSPVRKLPFQYVDFAVWQRKWLQGKKLEELLTFWKKYLRGVSALELPTDYSRSSVQTFQGARYIHSFPRKLTEKLQGLSGKERVTLFMTLLTAFQCMLHRYTGKDDIAVGTPVANRNRKEIEGLIGFFVNTIIIRNNLSGNQTFRELLCFVRKAALDSYAHQDLPFEKLVKELQPERDLSRNPLFQVMFALEYTFNKRHMLSGLTVEVMKVETKTSKFDITLYLTIEGGELIGNWEYNTDLFDTATIERMAGHYQRILEGIIVDPDQRLSDLPLLTEAEQQQLLAWNQTEIDYPKDQTIADLFQVQVEKTPENVAVVFEEQALSYQALNAKANQLAAYLRKLGVGPEKTVGICMERSIEMIVGFLGILKAGGVYLPLEPAYPKERLEFMIDDAKTELLLTEEIFLGCLPDKDIKKICLGREWDVISCYSTKNVSNLASSDSLAYIIYTSGSTGVPKGVEVSHRGVVRLLFGVDYVELGADETFLQLAPVSFDASTFEIWGALLHGAKCVLFPERVPTPEGLGDVIKKYEVSILWLTSSLFNTVIDEAPEALSTLKQLLIGGEALSVSHVRRALELLPSTQIINGYGPTENTTFTCCYPIPRQLCNEVTSISIGRPIGNTEVYILDTLLNPVPIGIYGELYIGGAGLARGYLNQPELTAESFIPNPFSKDPKSRLYKTGDIVRYLPDGNIEFSGRLDNQVKVRGYRIETGEIEHAVKEYPGIKECVVILKENKTNGEKLLIMYIVPDDEESTISIKELKIHIKQKLPYYMVPSGFVFLKSLPFNKNGKVDRIALVESDSLDAERETKYAGPRTVLELKIVQVWEKLIGKQPIGVTDDFFNLGGSSFLAIRVISEIGKISKVKLPLQDFLKEPTIENIAEILEGKQIKNERIPEVIGIQTSGDKPAFFCVSVSQKGNGFEYVSLSRNLDPDQPFYTPYLGNLNGKVTIKDAATECVKNIKTFQPNGPYYLGGWCYGGYVAFEAARQLEDQGEKVGMLALLDTHGPVYGYSYPAYLIGRILEFLRLPNKEKKSKLIIIYKIFRMRLRGFKRKSLTQKQASQNSEKCEIQFDMHHIDWSPKPLQCTIEVFMVKEQSAGRTYGEHYGWKKLARSKIRTHSVPGDHATFLSKYYKELGQYLNQCLKDAQRVN